MSESPISGEPDDGDDPFGAASDIFDLDSGFDVVHAQKSRGERAGPAFVFAVEPPRGGAALAEQIDQFMQLFLANHDDHDGPERLDAACYRVTCAGGEAEAEALRAGLARSLFDDAASEAVSVRALDAPAADDGREDEASGPHADVMGDLADIEAFDARADGDAEGFDGPEAEPEAGAAGDSDEDWLTAAANKAAHADGDTFDLDLLGPPEEPDADPAPDALSQGGGLDIDDMDDAAPEPDAEPDEADTFRADMRAIADAARGEDDAAEPVEDFQAALESLIGDLDARLGATADRLEHSAAHVDERAREALSALLSAGESLRGYAQSASGGSEPGRLDRMEAGLHAALDRLAEAQTAQETRIAERVIWALGGGTDADRAA